MPDKLRFGQYSYSLVPFPARFRVSSFNQGLVVGPSNQGLVVGPRLSVQRLEHDLDLIAIKVDSLSPRYDS